jgi:serine/threonine protein kinase
VPLVEVLDVPAARGRLHRYGSPPPPPTDVAIVLAWAALGSLADALAAGPIARAEALVMAHQLAGALGAMHAVGFVHGDLSPGNVLRADAGTRLADLGELARSMPHLGCLGGAGQLRGPGCSTAVSRPGGGASPGLGHLGSHRGSEPTIAHQVAPRAGAPRPALARPRPTATISSGTSGLTVAHRPAPSPRRPPPPRPPDGVGHDLATPAVVLTTETHPTGGRVGPKRFAAIAASGATAVVAALLALMLVRARAHGQSVGEV